jgi:hypothetical protein
MGKFKLSSIFSSSSSSLDAEAKKQNRRSFSLSASLRAKEALANGTSLKKKASKADTIATEKASSTSRMIELSQQISKASEIVDNYFKSQGLPVPSFDVDAPLDYPQLPEEVRNARLELIIATKELNRLAHGPRESVRWAVWEVCTPSFFTSDHASISCQS